MFEGSPEHRHHQQLTALRDKIRLAPRDSVTGRGKKIVPLSEAEEGILLHLLETAAALQGTLWFYGKSLPLPERLAGEPGETAP